MKCRFGNWMLRRIDQRFKPKVTGSQRLNKSRRPPKHGQVRLRHFHPGATTHRRQGRAGEHPPTIGHDPHQQPTFEPSARAGEGKRTLDIQLGKLGSFLRHQSVSCKTKPILPQTDQRVAPALQNYPSSATSAIPPVWNCTTAGILGAATSSPRREGQPAAARDRPFDGDHASHFSRNSALTS
jgi:hypothetical protein